MKGIFKKNQVIITSLALMLAVAGFLQMSGNETSDMGTGNGNEWAANSGTGVEEYYSVNAGDLADISDEDMAAGLPESGDETKATSAEVGIEEENKALAAGSENGENVGEAVLVSTTIRSDYAINAKLYREQARAKNKETLMEILGDESISEEQKQSTINALLEMTEITEKEQAAELLLEAKGFADPVVNIVNEDVDVVINATAVTDRQIAQIEDIVMRKTGAEAHNIVITAAVQQD